MSFKGVIEEMLPYVPEKNPVLKSIRIRELFVVRNSETGKQVVLRGFSTIPEKMNLKKLDEVTFVVKVRSELEFGWKSKIYVDQIIK